MAILKVLGIDPSMNNFGYAFATYDTTTQELKLAAVKLVSPKKESKKKSVRQNSFDLDHCKAHFTELLSYSSSADIVCVEIPVGSQTARAMASYGMCIGLLASVSKPMVQVTPTEVKLAAVGIKTATKAQMIEWATTKYPQLGWLKTQDKNGERFLEKNEHLADAIAVLEASLKTDNFKLLTLK